MTNNNLSATEFMLRFIVPVPPYHKCEYFRGDDDCTVLKYKCFGQDRTFISMRKNVYFDGCRIFTWYFFKFDGRDLIVTACIDQESDKQTIHPAGYPYIRFPQSFGQEEKWEYETADGYYKCISRLVQKKVDGELQEMLLVIRDFISVEEGGGICCEECYVAGKGMMGETVCDPVTMR